jgi:hypothetical protein
MSFPTAMVGSLTVSSNAGSVHYKSFSDVSEKDEKMNVSFFGIICSVRERDREKILNFYYQ